MSNASGDKSGIFPIGAKAPADYFTGTAWVHSLVGKNDLFNCTVANVVFEPGCRNNWHTHPGGQILVCTEGTGYYQEKGQPIQLLNPGDVVQIKPEIKHWHGASPNSRFTHLAIGTNTDKGVVDWLEPVTEEEYNSLNR